MYFKSATYLNVGPLHNIDIEFPFDGDGLPKPLLIVGENGSGKSLFLSHLVDALVEAAATHFGNVRPDIGNSRSQYFKTIRPIEVSVGKKYLAVHIGFDDGNEYLFKTGQETFESLRDSLHVNNLSLDWKGVNNYKQVTFNKNQIQEVFVNSVFCYFGPNRYEQPSWMGDLYLDVPRKESSITASPRYADILDNPIIVQHCAAETQSWLLNLIADSRIDFMPRDEKKNDAYAFARGAGAPMLESINVRSRVDEIMSAILGQDVFFFLDNRNTSESRLSIRLLSDGSVVCPSFNSLSTGQLALFELFTTIMRYADRGGIRIGSEPESISGVVIIDEADLHLHSDLQREAFPKLLRMFPHVQFVITTHSPLLLLGLAEEFGDEGIAVLNLPEGQFIGVEAFAEFQKAYDCYSQTRLHSKELQQVISSVVGNPLVVTEGKTDWRHIKAARLALEGAPNSEGLFEKGFELLERDDIEMGNEKLTSVCKSAAAIPQSRPIIFIADSDIAKTNKELCAGDKEMVKRHGNGVYSFVLPKPDFKQSELGVCIEQLYQDEVLRSWIMCEDGIKRRLFLSSEFDCFGRSGEGLIWKESHQGSKRVKNTIIVDGDSNHVVDATDLDNMTNHAISKKAFAEYILNNAQQFGDDRFEAFIPVFRFIQIAIQDFEDSRSSLI
ncbi:MAG: ATP-binding protein [Eggerthellaceae bacterium]|nr:ATP-binding protein [Eggerthellaceae bacterium]